MSSGFEVRYTETAREDLLRLFDFLLAAAQSSEDLDAAQEALDRLIQEVEGSLSRSPFAFRKAGESPFLRELVISHRRSGYVALYEIGPGQVVTILAVRHQREDDYH
jgi:plasmid stabilization system protein ParE